MHDRHCIHRSEKTELNFEIHGAHDYVFSNRYLWFSRSRYHYQRHRTSAQLHFVQVKKQGIIFDPCW